MKFRATRRDFLKVSAAACAAPVAALGGGPKALLGPSEDAAKLPASDLLTWGKEPLETESRRRTTICLNGVWQTMPAVNDSRQGGVPGSAALFFNAAAFNRPRLKGRIRISKPL